MKFFKKIDITIISVLLLICAVCYFAYRFFYSGHAAAAEIYYGSELVRTVNLNLVKDERFSIDQNKNVVFHVYPDGSICFEESDCPDKICIRSGRLSVVGQSAACLPNNIVLRIVDANTRGRGDLDAVVGLSK